MVMVRASEQVNKRKSSFFTIKKNNTQKYNIHFVVSYVVYKKREAQKKNSEQKSKSKIKINDKIFQLNENNCVYIITIECMFSSCVFLF